MNNEDQTQDLGPVGRDPAPDQLPLDGATESHRSGAASGGLASGPAPNGAASPDRDSGFERLSELPTGLSDQHTIARPTSPSTTGAAIEKPGDWIGQYMLVSELGEGGFGVVWLAERREPMVQRVALKIIKPGMDSRSVVARFEQERQALAVMDHPNVARVFDGGVTPTGRPYFVMELVQGEPISTFCDQQRYTISDRLKLFVTVCEAVQHAHMKGIIHRDIKPSNVLVELIDGRGVVKVIDFGVAKAIAPGDWAHTAFTQAGSIAGTPEYMSPEQVSGLADIDVRSDVYALGVLLYELLVGRLPFEPKELRARGYMEIQRIIREVEPPTPCKRLTTTDKALVAEIARTRQQARDSIVRTLRNELEWIPLKAMRKDREGRYRSAGELADDVRAFLEGRALAAGPPSATYRFRKYVRRHRGPVAAAALVLLALVFGLAGTLWQGRIARQRLAESDRIVELLRRPLELMGQDLLTNAPGVSAGDPSSLVTDAYADLPALSEKEQTALDIAVLAELQLTRLEEARALAEQERDAARDALRREAQARTRAESVIAFVTSALQSGDPYEGGTRSTTIMDAMERAIVDIESGRFAGDRETGARLKHTIATILDNNARSAEAEPLFESALKTLRELYPGDHPDVARSINALAGVRESLGQTAAAEPLYLEALHMRRRLFPGDHPDVAESLNNLAHAIAESGRAEEADALYVESLKMNRRLHTGDHPMLATVMNNRAFVLQHLGRTAEAEALLVEALAMLRRLQDGDHPSVALALNNLALFRDNEGRSEEAGELYAESLEMMQRMFPGDHRLVAAGLNNLASVMESLGNTTDAEPIYDEALAMARRLYDSDHALIVECALNVASARLSQGRSADARPLFAQAVAMNQRLHPGDHPSTARALDGLAFCMKVEGEPAEAEAMMVQALEMSRRMHAGDHADVARRLNSVAFVRHELGRSEEAEEMLTEALDMLHRLYPGDHPDIARALNNLASVRMHLGKLEEAEALLIDAVEMTRRMFEGDHPFVAISLSSLARARLRLGRTADAIAIAEEAATMAARVFPPGHPNLVQCEETLARCQAARDE